MQHYGLIGKRLSHSFSEQYFESKFVRERISDATYRLYELEDVGQLREWIAAQEVQGFNVTIPFKEAVLAQIDTLSPEAAAVGAVNVVRVEPDGRLTGFNTDAPAFEHTLQPLLRPWHKTALILGTGGAAKAVAYALGRLGIDHLFVSRTRRDVRTIGYAEATKMAAERLLVVNATPVGMYPEQYGNPWPDEAVLCSRHLCYDLIYNPEFTPFLQTAKRAGAVTCNGRTMLEQQAEMSWAIWQERGTIAMAAEW